MNKIIFIINSNKTYLYLWKCIERINLEIENSFITIYIHKPTNKSPNKKFNTCINSIDSKFSNLKTNPFDVIDLNLKVNNKQNIQVINKLDALEISDWIILEDKHEKNTFEKYSKNGLLYLDLNYNLIRFNTLHKQLIKLSIIYCNTKSKNWQEIVNVNLKSELGFKNNVHKILLNYSIYLAKFLKTIDNPSKTNLGNINVFKKTLKSSVISKFNVFLYYIKLVFIIISRKFKKQQFNWKIGIKKGSETTFLNQPKNSFWADPFIVKGKNGNSFVYFEELKKDHLGKISCVEINSKFEIIDKQDIINTNYHVSFPNVFLKDNNYYMIPESSQISTLQLFKCQTLPFKWELKMNLMENIKLLDAVWVYHNNLYWIFANKIEDFEYDNNEKLYLYYSDNLFSNKWKPHIKNPIITDASLARNAGSFILENGKLIRPSQNCFDGYGKNIVMNEVKVLNTENYIEEKINVIFPVKGYVGSHTFNSHKDLCILDFLLKE